MIVTMRFRFFLITRQKNMSKTYSNPSMTFCYKCKPVTISCLSEYTSIKRQPILGCDIWWHCHEDRKAYSIVSVHCRVVDDNTIRVTNDARRKILKELAKIKNENNDYL